MRYSFDNFIEDMGRRPTPKHSLDRIDVNGNYGPDNCKWATIAEQNRNKRRNRYLEYNGVRMILKDWAAFIGINYMAIHCQLKKKSFEEVIHFYEEKYILQWEKL